MVKVNIAKRRQWTGGVGGCCGNMVMGVGMQMRSSADCSKDSEPTYQRLSKVRWFFGGWKSCCYAGNLRDGRIARYRGTQNTDNLPQKNAVWCRCPINSPEEDR